MKENEKKNKKFAILTVLLLLLGVGIGYAAITGHYDFTGIINIKGNKWDISVPTTGPNGETEEGEGIEVVTTPSTEPDPDAPSTEPTSPAKPPVISVDTETGTIQINYTADLAKPGDEYSFIAPITNNGSLNAIITSVETTNTLAENQQHFLKYSITDEEGNDLKDQKIKANGGKLKVKVTVRYNDDADLDYRTLPEEDVEGVQYKTVITMVQK